MINNQFMNIEFSFNLLHAIIFSLLISKIIPMWFYILGFSEGIILGSSLVRTILDDVLPENDKWISKDFLMRILKRFLEFNKSIMAFSHGLTMIPYLVFLFVREIIQNISPDSIRMGNNEQTNQSGSGSGSGSGVGNNKSTKPKITPLEFHRRLSAIKWD